MKKNNVANDILNNVFEGVNEIENSQAVNEMLDKFKLNWRVEKQPLILPSGDETRYFGIVRTDTNVCLHACKGSYEPFQNSLLSEMLIRISGQTGYEIVGGGEFNGGGKVYMQLKSPNVIKNIGNNNDKVNGNLTGINSHDGTTALKWGMANTVISCKNTFMAALKEIKSSAKHTQSIHRMVEQAINELSHIVKEEKTMFDKFITLSETPVTRKEIAKIVREVTDVDILSKTTDQYSTYQMNRTAELLQSVNNEMKQKGETMWGLFNGVTYYTNHVMPVPKRDNARTESIFVGSGYRINNDIYNLISN